jgi:lipid II:glycine glycyltransferase (peptidoglycan interpeptide bridge formation enzyme)
MGEGEGAREGSVWDRFLAASRPDVGYKQHAWWGDLLATRGWGHFEVVVGEHEDAILGGARVYVQSFAPGQCYYYVPDGPVLPADPDEAERVFEATMAFLDEQRRADPWTVSHVRIEPRWRVTPAFVRGFREARNWKEPRDTLCVDLALSEEEILAQMKPKGRYNTGLARRKGVRVVEDPTSKGFADFLALYRETFARHGLSGHSDTYFRSLEERLFVGGRGSIFFAEHVGRRLATALVLYQGDTATYKYGGSSAEQRNLMAPYLLHFEVMRDAKARGHRWYDFYGIAPPGKPDDRWANFSEFKRKFGGTEIHFVPALDHVYDEAAFRAYEEKR